MQPKNIINELGYHLKFYGFKHDRTKEPSASNEWYWRRDSQELHFSWNSERYICKIEQKLSQHVEWRPIVEVPIQRVGWRWFSRMDWGRVSSKLLPPLNAYLAVNNADKALFPLTVRWFDEDEVETLDSVLAVACNLEYFDSEDLKQEATVHDLMGRPVRLLVEALDVIKCELE